MSFHQATQTSVRTQHELGGTDLTIRPRLRSPPKPSGVTSDCALLGADKKPQKLQTVPNLPLFPAHMLL